MMLDEFAALLITADPSATKWKGAGTGNYTVWRPYETGGLIADGMIVESRIKIQLDRYTKSDVDPVVTAIAEVLAGDDDISFKYFTEFEQDTGYIHHIWDCEVV